VLSHLPGNALRTGLVWSAIGGIVPTALALTLPLAVGVGATAVFAQLRADSTLHILFTLRFSVLALCRPVLWVSLATTLLVFLLSCVIAPRSVTQIHDTVFIIKNNLSAALFDPQTFYTLDDGRYTFFFDRRLRDNLVEGIFFQETATDGTRNLIIAREARFEVRGDEQHILFATGSLQTLAQDGQPTQTIEFEELARPFGHDERGTMLRRSWRGMFELGTMEFLSMRGRPFENANLRQAWMAEFVKRFAVPLLALGHPMIGIALVLLWGRNAGRRLPPPQLFCVPVVLLHMLVLFGAESVHYFGAWMAWLAIGTILAELLLAGTLLLRMQRRAI